MSRKLLTAHCLLFASFLFLPASCTLPTSSLETSLLLYRFDPPAFLEYDEDFQLTKEIPYSIPPNCGLFDTFPAPSGPYLLIELSCPNGQTVLFLDLESASVSQPVPDADSHFLAWTSDGKSVYLKVNSLSNPQVLRVYANGKQEISSIPEFTYDLAVSPVNDDITYAFSRGLGHGSELHGTQYAVRNTQLLYADSFNYISFARFSPDGSRIAFIKIPDMQTPFTVGELWVTDSDGANARKLADADTGHGYAANWSPDGTKIAFVVRENPSDERADNSSEALLSNIYVVEVETGNLTTVTNFADGYAGTPFWSPAGNTLTFNVVVNGRMQVHIADVDSGEIRPIDVESACCPAWIRK